MLKNQTSNKKTSNDKLRTKRESDMCGYLQPNENQLLLSLIPRGCRSLCTTIAQVYQTVPPKHSVWANKITGVLCFIEDHTQKSYFMQLYCLVSHKMVWEQELYLEIKLTNENSFFITFEGAVRENFIFDQVILINF